MLKVYSYIVLLFLLSCSSTKSNTIVREHGECNVTALQVNNKYNDTSRVKFIKSVIFDTTATLVHGYLIESNSFRPIPNAEVTLFSRNEKIITSTNLKGEFEIFQNLNEGPWNLLVKHSNYICLYISAVIKSGGQWFYIKLEPK